MLNKVYTNKSQCPIVCYKNGFIYIRIIVYLVITTEIIQSKENTKQKRQIAPNYQQFYNL